MKTFITIEDVVFVDQYSLPKSKVIIEDVQRSYIKPLFKKYYDYLMGCLENERISKQDEYIVNEYIKPIMILYTENEFYLKSDIKINNVGASREVGENFERMSTNQKQTLINANLEKISVMKGFMHAYLSENSAVYPYYVPTEEYMNYNHTTVNKNYMQKGLYGYRG
jgi:hypothetical protein